MVAATQAFLIWVHFAILRGILKKQAMALMTSLLLAGTHSLCALALPNIDFYTRNFLWASILVFIVTMSQFISQLVELRA